MLSMIRYIPITSLSALTSLPTFRLGGQDLSVVSRALQVICAAGFMTGLALASAEGVTISLDDGSQLDGTIIKASRNTVVLRRDDGGVALLPVTDIDIIEVGPPGAEIIGHYGGWVDGVYKVIDDDDLFHVTDDGTAVPVAQEAGSYRLATNRPDRTAYAVGVGISTLTKIKLLPELGIDLSPIVTSGFSENVTLLNEQEVQFALLDTSPNETFAGSAANHIRAIATLWQEAGKSTQLVVRYDVDDTVVYEVTKVIFENLRFLQQIHDILSETSLDHALSGLNLPLHPGARRYYETKDALSIALYRPQTASLPNGTAPQVSTSNHDARIFTVRFDGDEAAISADSMATLEEVEALAERLENGEIWIAGYTGEADENSSLVRRRVEAVRAHLSTRGVEGREVDFRAFAERSSWAGTTIDDEGTWSPQVRIFVEPAKDPIGPAANDRPVGDVRRENKHGVGTRVRM